MPEPTSPKPSGLWARLFTATEPEETEVEALAEAQPAPTNVQDLEAPSLSVEFEVASPVPLAEAPSLEPCPACGTIRQNGLSFCGDCGWMFGPANPTRPIRSSASTPSPRVAVMPPPQIRIKDRYEIGALIGQRDSLCRYQGLDHGRGAPTPVTILWGPLAAEATDPLLAEVPMADFVDEEIMPGFDDEVPMAAIAEESPGPAGWPSAAWEKGILDRARHPSLPAVVEHFIDNNFEYLVVEAPRGRSLWDAWDEPEADANVRYGWLQQIAEGLEVLHQAGALLEGLCPDQITVTESGQAMLTNLANLLPLPVPAQAPLRGTLYTAPELILSPGEADGRSTLYSFGASLYALEFLHHDLEEKDFERQFTPLQVTERFPDVHPMFLRLVNKTFVRDVNSRFPTDEAHKTDPTGIKELIKTLDICRRNFDNVRLDVAAWTTTGMVRTGNEDAFAFLHGVDSRQDDLHEYTMILLADGMGGYEAGEVAAAMAIAEARKFLLQQPMFAALTGKDCPPYPTDAKAYKDVLFAALKHANKEVFTASRTPGKGKRGMGCTLELVYVDPKNLIVGHVGDSRVYHLHQGRLVQVTRDQTLVNRLVELGQLTAEEAEDHPRKNELQQAIGGQPDVNPGLYHSRLRRGDWVLVCSDGLSNHISHQELEKMMSREAAGSAEEAARRLLNLVNLRGATDNATIVVVRAS